MNVPTYAECEKPPAVLAISDIIHPIHGERGHSSYQHADRYDGKHLPKNSRDEKRVDATGKESG